MTIFEPPAKGKSGFTCPTCGAYAAQQWADLCPVVNHAVHPVDQHISRATCHHCLNNSYWYDEALIYPDMIPVAAPNQDLAEEIQADYWEAASILTRSPRGAAALLRLCVQKLCKQLGEKGGKIDDDIASLVRKGLPIRVQQALDSVRVIGNDAVHPGEMALEDDRATATVLFTCVNLIAQVMLTQPKEIGALYNTLPAKKLEAIQKRDSKGSLEK